MHQSVFTNGYVTSSVVEEVNSTWQRLELSSQSKNNTPAHVANVVISKMELWDAYDKDTDDALVSMQAEVSPMIKFAAQYYYHGIVHQLAVHLMSTYRYKCDVIER